MANILFLALQCCECSTMQVKQKKTSSNKWVCVICNQKQSVTKVFAQGFKAKDLRFFVQSFNMSRKAADEKKQTFSEVEFQGEIDEEVSVVRGKRPSDWSEYLDSDLPDDRLRAIAEEDDVKIVTEMPNGMFKRPKLNKYSNAGGSSSVTRGGGGKEYDNELFKPSFSRRDTNKPSFPSDGVVTRNKDTVESVKVAKPASKWDAYLIDEGGNRAPPRLAQRDVVKDDDVGQWDRAVMEMNTEYQIVDDEVHPDFM